MTPEEKTEFQKTRGEQSFSSLKALFLNKDYDKMTQEEKINAINKVYDKAYESAKKQLALSRGVPEIDYKIGSLSKEAKEKTMNIVNLGIEKSMAYKIVEQKDINNNEVSEIISEL